MRRKFINEYGEKKCIIHTESNTIFSECTAGSAFSNGWFALVGPLEVLNLYNQKGELVRKNIFDVYVFLNGYMVVKNTATQRWNFFDNQRKFIFSCYNVEVFTDHLFGAEMEQGKWQIIYLKNSSFSILDQCNADMVGFLIQSSTNGYVLYSEKDGVMSIFNLNKMGERGVSVLKNVKYFAVLPTGKLVISADKLVVDSYGGVCTFVETQNRQSLQIFDADLEQHIYEVNGLVMYDNGIYLLEDKYGEWHMFNRSHKELLSDIYQLHNLQSEAYDNPCIFFANSHDGGHISISYVSRDYLEYAHINDKKIITRSGEVYDVPRGNHSFQFI